MVVRPHVLPPPELEFPRTLHTERHRMETVDVPVVTTSASFRSDIARSFKEKGSITRPDIVFSRAHFSMAVAILAQAAQEKLSSWLVDPINYISEKDWEKIAWIVGAGRAVARFHILKHFKDILDSLLRGRLPLAEAITPPLLYVTTRVTRPVISLHYETGNILAREGKTVVQVVTDPHVRPQYLQEAWRKNISYAVFDPETKERFLNMARDKGIAVAPERIIVTGPPVDPRIVEARKKKSAGGGRRPLKLAMTTGGLGQNKSEIKKLVGSIGPEIKEGRVRVVLYASTLPDFRSMYEEMAQGFGIAVGNLADSEAALRIVFYPSIVDANQALIEHIFPWADGFVTKPSGDMAYDAVAAGCFILLLKAWGEWEENVESVFVKLGIAQKASPDGFARQVEQLVESGWIKDAVTRALNIDHLFLNGARNIVDLQQGLPVQ